MQFHNICFCFSFANVLCASQYYYLYTAIINYIICYSLFANDGQKWQKVEFLQAKEIAKKNITPKVSRSYDLGPDTYFLEFHYWESWHLRLMHYNTRSRSSTLIPLAHLSSLSEVNCTSCILDSYTDIGCHFCCYNFSKYSKCSILIYLIYFAYSLLLKFPSQRVL